MSDYHFPFKDASFLIKHILGFDQTCQDAGLEDVNAELADAISTSVFVSMDLIKTSSILYPPLSLLALRIIHNFSNKTPTTNHVWSI